MPPAGPAVSPNSSPSAGTGSSAPTAHRTCSPTRGGVSQKPSSTSLSWTGCRCPMRRPDVIVCALALVHVPRLQPVLAEFARVLRPGGDPVISDVHHELVTRGP